MFNNELDEHKTKHKTKFYIRKLFLEMLFWFQTNSLCSAIVENARKYIYLSHLMKEDTRGEEKYHKLSSFTNTRVENILAISTFSLRKTVTNN